MWNNAQNGKTPNQHWIDFCINTIEEILDECRDILIRLKN